MTAEYRVTDKNGVRQSVSKDEYERLVGTRDTRPYVFGVWAGRMALADVPEALRTPVEQSVAARTAFSGPYQLPSAQTLEILTGGAAT